MIDKCWSHNLRKKLLEARGTLTLQKAREMARSAESGWKLSKIDRERFQGWQSTRQRPDTNSRKPMNSEGYNWRVYSLTRDPLAMSLTGRRGRCSKRKKIKCASWISNKKLYSHSSEEPLNTAGEFKDRQCCSFRCCGREGKANTQPIDLWTVGNIENRDKLCQWGELAERIWGNFCWSWKTQRPSGQTSCWWISPAHCLKVESLTIWVKGENRAETSRTCKPWHHWAGWGANPFG